MFRLVLIFVFGASFFSTGCSQAGRTATSAETVGVPTVATNSIVEKIEKSEEEWKKILDPEEFRILRQQGTERSFTGKYWDNKKAGVYNCAGCQLSLFTSNEKFVSGTGWPSFWQPINKAHVLEKADNAYGWNRVEILCGRCDGHLGHVFEDGPEPTGLRYCINGNALDFVEEGEEKK